MLSQLIETCNQPLSKACYAQQKAVRNQSPFVELADAMALLAAPVPQQPNWQEVVEWVKVILSEQSKDCMALAYGCHALMQCYRWEGLLAGLAVLNWHCEQLWDQLYPSLKKLSVRERAWRWWLERLQAMITHGVEAPNAEQCANLIEAFEKLRSIWLEVLPDLAPACHRMIQYFERALVPDVENTVDAVPEADVAQALPNSQLAVPTSSIDNVHPVQQSIQTGEKLDVQQLRWHRYQAWFAPEVLAALEVGEWDGNAEHAKADWQSAYQYMQQAQWQSALEAWEAVFLAYPFWLDVQRYMAECLQALSADDARLMALKQTLKQLLLSAPQLLTATWKSGHYCADQTTRDWLCFEVVDCGCEYHGNAAVMSLLSTYCENPDHSDYARWIQQTKSPLSALGYRIIWAEALLKLEDDKKVIALLSGEFETMFLLATLSMPLGISGIKALYRAAYRLNLGKEDLLWRKKIQKMYCLLYEQGVSI